MLRVRLLLSVLAVVLTIAATVLAGSAALTARHPGLYRGFDPETASVRTFTGVPAEGRRWAAVAQPLGRRW